MSAPSVARAAPSSSPPPAAAQSSALDILDHIGTIGAYGVAAYMALLRAAKQQADSNGLDAEWLATVLKVSREYAARALRDLESVGAAEHVLAGNKKLYRLRRRTKRPVASVGEVRAKSGTIVPEIESLEPGTQKSGTPVPEIAMSGTPVPDSGTPVPETRPAGKEVFLSSSKFKSKSTNPPNSHVLLEGQAPGGAGPKAPTPAAPPGGPEPDLRFRFLRNYIPAAYKRRWGHEMPVWGPAHDYQLELSLSKLPATFDDVMLKLCVDHALDERAERPPQRQDPLKWISILHEFLGGAKDRYGNTIGDEEVHVGNATTGRTAAIAALRTNKTLARASLVRAATARAFRAADEREREAARHCSVPGDARHVCARDA